MPFAVPLDPRLPLLHLALVLTALGCAGSPDQPCPDGSTAPCTQVTTGSLAITVSGLAAATPAAITVAGQGVTRVVRGTETLTLEPGSYAIAAAAVVGGSLHYEPVSADQPVTVAKGQTTSPSWPTGWRPLGFICRQRAFRQA